MLPLRVSGGGHSGVPGDVPGDALGSGPGGVSGGGPDGVPGGPDGVPGGGPGGGPGGVLSGGPNLLPAGFEVLAHHRRSIPQMDDLECAPPREVAQERDGVDASDDSPACGYELVGVAQDLAVQLDLP